MIDVIDNISGYFDDDMVNIIYKDLKLNGLSDEEVENLLKEKHRDLPMIEINVFQLNNYKLGSIGFTSRELENLKIDFCEEKLLSNDYNGENPTNQIVYLKVLFDKESKKILGCQIANERNIEARLKAIKAIMEKGGDLKELVKYKVNPTDNEWNPDILNLLALTALGKDKEIKVGITTNGSLEHGRLTIFSSENKVQIYNDDFDITVGENERVDVRNSSGAVTITLENGKEYKTRNPLNFYAKGEYLTISPVRKAHTTSPKYRGILTIIPRGSSLRVINTIDIEKYLLQVVASEMPRSFGVEALKVQAVAARTYAVSDILKGKYAKDGFHIKDTVESQVYNNQVENEDATRAIKETAGEIMTYDGMPIDAKYFSTSSGFTSHASNVW